MSPRVPPSTTRPLPTRTTAAAQRAAPSASAQRGAPAQRSRRAGRAPQGNEKPTKGLKSSEGQAGEEEHLNSPEAQKLPGPDMDRSPEAHVESVQQALEQAESEEALAEMADKEEEKDDPKSSWVKQGSTKGEPKSLLNKQRQAQQDPAARLPAFMQPAAGKADPGKTDRASDPGRFSAQGAAKSERVGPAPNLLTGESAKSARPPDAFTVLKDAKEKGQLFVEDSLSQGQGQAGQPEQAEDPELSKAVVECRALCEGVPGILRIGPGHNDQKEPVILVTTNHGFAEASLVKVPQKVHRFATLIVIPFDLLPLRRER